MVDTAWLGSTVAGIAERDKANPRRYDYQLACLRRANAAATNPPESISNACSVGVTAWAGSRSTSPAITCDHL